MKRFYRTLSVLLALLLTVSLVGPAAFAQENAPASQPNAGTAPACAQLEGCENGEHNVQCPLYVSNENTAAQKVIELLSNLPTAEQVQSYVPVLSLPQEDAGYQQAYTEAVQAYQNMVKEQMAEASAAYGALAEQEKQLVSADLLSKLQQLEALFSEPAVPNSNPQPQIDQADAVAQIVRAEGTVFYATLAEAVADAKSGETITLLKKAAFEKNGQYYFDIPPSQDAQMALTIDLNGQTVDASSCKAKVYGNLTIQDSKGTGIIDAGSQGQAIEIKANASLTLKGGTIKTTGYGAVRTAGKSFFTMTGGVLEGAPAIQVIGGTLNITGGQVKAATNSYAAIESSSSAALTIGEAVSGTQTQEQAQKVYVASVNPQKGDVVFNSGVIGKVTGKFGPNALLSGWFESDITAQLPSGKICKPIAGTSYYQVQALEQQDAAAQIGGVLYATLPAAIAELKNDQTLTLLQDYSGEKTLSVNAYGVTIDLNGHSLTNTKDGAVGLEIYPKYSTKPGNQTTVTIRNSGTKTAVIQASTPLKTKSGNSQIDLPILLGENVQLQPTGTGAALSMEGSSYINYTPANAAYVKNGGFKSTHADGKDYIHGSFSAAAKNDQNKTAVLLNDYDAKGDYIGVITDGLTLDLNSKTYTVSSNKAIGVNQANVGLTIKNGKIENKTGDGAEVGVGYDNCSLTLENVELVAAGDYGIVTNGTYAGMQIQIKGGSVKAPNGIGVYMPSKDSTLLVDGATISGNTGIAIKGGTLTVKNGSTVQGTGVANIPDTPESSGVSDTGDAIYVEGNYGFEIQLQLEGGSFVSENGKAVQMLFEDASSAPQEIVVTGGSYSSDVRQYIAANHDELVTNQGQTPYIVGKYSDTSASQAVGTLTAKITTSKNVDIYFATLQEALEAARQEIAAGGTAVVTLQNNTGENLEIDQTITILKNGFTAQNIKPASGYLLNETSESYSIYAFTPPAPTQVYTVKYLLAQLDGSFAEQTQDTKTNVPADQVQQMLSKSYTGFSILDVQLDEASHTYTVRYSRDLYTVSFISEGTTLESVNYPYQATAKAPAAPVREGYTFQGWSDGNKTLAANEEWAVTQPQEFLALWKKNGSSSSNTGSGSTSDPVDQNYDFWKEVENKILASADNATVSVNAGEYGRMPVSVLNALRSRKNVTLKITYQGKTISITSQKAPVAAGDRIYWSLDELIKLFGASSGNSNHNPGTGSTDLPASLAVLALLASAAAVVSIRKKR